VSGVQGITDVAGKFFSTASRCEGSALVVEMRGNADVEAVAALGGFLEQLDATAKRLGVDEAVLELHDLYFMNSTCMSLLMRRVSDLMKEQTTKRYKLRFRSNPNLRWQKRSLQALRSLAQEIVIVE
jgi:anti-anti-sigma factor